MEKGRPQVAKRKQSRPGPSDSEVRIIGGRLRGTKLRYQGDPRTRPMKHRVREAVFNILQGRTSGAFVLDLFAGTGALAIEAISRGAIGGLLLETHRPTAAAIGAEIKRLDLQALRVETGDAFAWAERPITGAPRTAAAEVPPPWLVFVAPPYAFFHERLDEMRLLLHRLWEASPEESLFIVESDDRFDPAELQLGAGDVRNWPPARVTFWER